MLEKLCTIKLWVFRTKATERGEREKGGGGKKKVQPSGSSKWRFCTCDDKKLDKGTQSVSGWRFGTVSPAPSKSVPCHFPSPLSTLNTQPPHSSAAVLGRERAAVEGGRGWRESCSLSPATPLPPPPPRTTKQRHAFGPGCESKTKRLHGACDNEIGRQNREKGNDDSNTYAHTCAQHGSSSSSVIEGTRSPLTSLAVFSPSRSVARFELNGLRAHNTIVFPTFR